MPTTVLLSQPDFLPGASLPDEFKSEWTAPIRLEEGAVIGAAMHACAACWASITRTARLVMEAVAHLAIYLEGVVEVHAAKGEAVVDEQVAVGDVQCIQ